MGGMARDALGWLRAHLFNTWYNALLSLAALGLLVLVLPPLLDWALRSAVFGPAPPSACRASEGACWAIIAEKYRLILFGTYPYEAHWRPLLACALFVGALAASALPRMWHRGLILLWIAVLAVAGLLLRGGLFGLDPVPNTRWGGLTLTLLLSVVGVALAFPLAIALALGRRSDLPVIRALSIAYIELIRGVPLVTVLFMASVMFPLFLPEGISIDKLLRAQVALILFIAAYLAEVIRAGLQAVPRGQYEAAAALGLSYWQRMGHVVLPQALRVAIPPMVNTFIGAFKDTSLVVIIGLFDLMLATRAALADAPWRPYFVEAYLFTGAIYWLFCFAMSRYSQWLEGRLTPGGREGAA